MDDLRRTLDDLLASGAPTNAAFDALLDDYVRFHLALAVLGGLFLVVVITLTVLAVRRLRSVSRRANEGTTFRRFATVGVVVGGIALAASLGLVVAANLSTVANPRQGLAGSLEEIGDPVPGSHADAVQQGFTDWLRSGDPSPPDVVRRAVDDRLAWQRPKAIICAVLLIITVASATLAWRAVLRTTAEEDHRWGARSVSLLAGGVLAVGVSTLLMLMVMGNGQASVAPTAMTLFFG